MISQIGPLVEVGRRRRLFLLHVLGGVTGGIAAGALLALGATGALALVGDSPTAQASAAAVAAVILLLAGAGDLGLVSLPHWTTNRQTPGSWTCALGEPGAVFAWGLDLGTGLTTRRAYRTTLALPLAATALAISQTVWLPVLALGAYGASRAISVTLVAVAARGDFARSCDMLLRWTSLLLLVVGASALATGVVAAAAAWAP